MNSMTGFGRAEGMLGELQLTVELVSVNKRNLELGFSLPRDWQSLERPLSEQLRAGLQRGKVNWSVQVQAAGESGAFVWDEVGVAETLKRLEKEADMFGIPWEPDADLLFKVAQQHRGQNSLPPVDEAAPVLAALTGEALEALCRMRADEGEALRIDLAARLETLAELYATVTAARAETPERYREMLFARLRQAGLELELEDERVLREVAIFADRCDVSEELTRLESHLTQLRQLLAESGAVGRRLEFLLQEVIRETNTVGAKANNLGVTQPVLEAKNEIERLREQVQNVE